MEKNHHMPEYLHVADGESAGGPVEVGLQLTRPAHLQAAGYQPTRAKRAPTGDTANLMEI